MIYLMATFTKISREVKQLLKLVSKQDTKIYPHVQRYKSLFFSKLSTVRLNEMFAHTQKSHINIWNQDLLGFAPRHVNCQHDIKGYSTIFRPNTA